MSDSVIQVAVVVQAIGTAALALLAVIQAYYLFLTFKVYRMAWRPMLFTSLRDKAEQPGIRIENPGNGVAWNGRVIIAAMESHIRTEFHFATLYPRSGAEYPEPGQRVPLFDSLRDRRLRIEIVYTDEERGGKTYHWHAESVLPVEWLNKEHEGTHSRDTL